MLSEIFKKLLPNLKYKTDSIYSPKLELCLGPLITGIIMIRLGIHDEQDMLSLSLSK